MDEYFCPNCGSILNHQSGFDPSLGTWTCTECGQGLMDDDIYNGDTYKGVAWYCDNCNSLLNKQFGFSDSYGTWTCTECGYVNGTTEDDIYESKKDYENKKRANEWADILSLSANLIFQSIKNRKNKKDCSTVDEKEKFKCPNCEDILENQFCFDKYEDDWTCTSCGAHLHHYYSDDPYTVVDEEVDDDGDGNEYNDNESYDNSSYNSSEYTSSYNNSNSYNYEKVSNKELRNKRFKAFLFKRKKIEVGYDCDDLLRKNVLDVYILLHNKAFNNIKVVPINDIYFDSAYKEGKVEQVVIGKKSFFKASYSVPFDTEITITYHEKKKIKIPFSSRYFYKRNYIEVKNYFQKLGFTEIYEQPIRNLITGWIKKDGAVQKVIIDGDNHFKKNTAYKYDAKITIEYSTFKSKR